MMFRKVKLLFVLLALMQSFGTSAQSQFAFQITFTDKNNTPYSLSSPSAYLSPRSLARRTTQGIAIDSTDLPVNAAYVDSVLTLTGGVLHETSKWLNMCMLLLTDSSQILTLTGKPYVKNIALVGYYGSGLHHRSSNTTTVPAARTSTTCDIAYYGGTCPQTVLVNGNYLHDKGYNGEGKLIAVFDAGFFDVTTNPGFDSLRASGRIVDTFDFVWHDSNVYQQDDHGGMVLSTMAGYWPGTYVGSAPKASYALYLTEYDPDDQPLELDNMLCAAERADSIGADVITESLGYDIFSYPPGAGQVFSMLDGATTIAAQAANIATAKGMLFVATAGNDGSPAIAGWGTHILTPGDADSALTIGSTDNNGIVSGFSGFGPNAAGVMKPDVSAMGTAAAVLNSTYYATADGTSFSTPQVAGWATCLWQETPLATPAQIRNAIIKCASQYTSPNFQIGFGVPNFECTSQMLNVRDTPAPFTPGKWILATPNPFTNDLTHAVSPNAPGNVTFRLMDMAGRQIFSVQYYLQKGYNSPFTVPVPALPPGLYILRANSGTQQQILKLEKR